MTAERPLTLGSLTEKENALQVASCTFLPSRKITVKANMSPEDIFILEKPVVTCPLVRYPLPDIVLDTLL